MQRCRRDVLPGSGLDRHLVGHLKRLSQGQDDLIGLRLHGGNGRDEEEHEPLSRFLLANCFMSSPPLPSPLFSLLSSPPSPLSFDVFMVV